MSWKISTVTTIPAMVVRGVGEGERERTHGHSTTGFEMMTYDTQRRKKQERLADTGAHCLGEEHLADSIRLFWNTGREWAIT